MMYGHERSDPAIVAVKPTNKAESNPLRSWWIKGRGPRGMRTSKPTAGARGNSRPYREPLWRTFICCTCSRPVLADIVASPKLSGANFSVLKKSDRRPLIRVPSIALPRSSGSLSSGDEVPHIFTRKSRLKPGKFLITSAKRLLQ
jgi:hypothetical protein